MASGISIRQTYVMTLQKHYHPHGGGGEGNKVSIRWGLMLMVNSMAQT